jgi:hypothetical protein
MRCLIPLVLAVPLCIGTLRAQERTRRDSIPADSVGRDSTQSDSTGRVRSHPVHPSWAALVMPGLIVIPLVAAFVPTPLAWIGPRGPSAMEFLQDHDAAYVSVGGRFSKGETWANGVALESVRRDVHTEVVLEDFWRPRHVRYVTARAGYLWHPTRFAAAGATLGYVHASGDPMQRGVELGLPVYLGGASGTLRLEPTYVASREGALWSYRLQAEATIPHTAFFAGAAVNWKSLPLTSEARQDFEGQTLSLLFGTRL